MKLSNVFRQLVLSEVASLQCATTGRPQSLCPDQALDHMFKVLRTGMQWRELDATVSYTTVFRRFHAWAAAGIFSKAYVRALATYRRLHPTAYYCVDSSYVKNRFGQRGVGRNHTDRGRKALKLSVVTDHNGVCFAARTDPANRPDVTLLGASLDAILTHVDGVCLYADRGYDSRNNRLICTGAGMRDRIFRRKTKRGHMDRRLGTDATFHSDDEMAS